MGQDGKDAEVVAMEGTVQARGNRSPLRLLSMIAMSLAACLGVGAGSTGCVVHDDRGYGGPLRSTEIQFTEEENIGNCGSNAATFSWTVTNRQTQDTGTAQCGQPVLFQDLTAGARYDFDIVGYAGSQLCWQGACNVTAVYGATTFPDCSAQIQHLCGN